jgi:uncharacterized protein (TIGR03083 family)
MMSGNPGAAPISHDEWIALAAAEYRRINEVLAALPPAKWDAATDCPPWRVRDIVAHLVGAAEATASVREQLRQQRVGRRTKGARSQLDAVNDIHVRERSGLSPAELQRRLHDRGRRGIRARGRIPAPVRKLRFPFPPPVGWASLGHLYDTVYTRDAWMHRVDICRATGAPLVLTADHDARIVADAAREWMHVTGPRALVLTGPAGSVVSAGRGHDRELTYDAVAFARALSGRSDLPGVCAGVILF